MLVIDHFVAREILMGGPDSTPLAFRIDKVQERRPGIILPQIAVFELKRCLAEDHYSKSKSVITDKMSSQIDMLSTSGIEEFASDALWAHSVEIMKQMRLEHDKDIGFVYAYLIAYTIRTKGTLITNQDNVRMHLDHESKIKQVSDFFFSVTWNSNGKK